ncbi:alpha/beta hydrolase [Hamadaea tsunoensis]|uniref:alpha/beta hydrolase n=1 Tax=Hamadaea tsunoensis TaxID=53368 RepID=UPI000420EE7E|nr:alpha/beta hydrolase [Hamadaea tsunoensis]
MAITRLAAVLIAGGLAGTGAAFGVPLLAPESADLPAPDVRGWTADPVTATLDPLTATPDRVAAFLAGLSPVERAALAARHPEVLGGLDGAPIALRYAANRRLGAPAGRTFLEYDPRGDGRAVEVVGDLATADRIAVIVPGVNTTLADFDRGLGGVARRAPAYQARGLLAALRAADPGARVAAVAWLGYDPPEGLDKAAVREDRAVAGAKALSRFVAGLTAVRPHAAVTVVGHSYGTVVIGRSSFGPAVTDVVALGSPGMGVPAAATLRTSGRVWAARAAGDWIGRVPHVQFLGLGHGEDPTSPGFGARILPTDGVDGHDGYFSPGSATLAALARVILTGSPS